MFRVQGLCNRSCGRVRALSLECPNLGLVGQGSSDDGCKWGLIKIMGPFGVPNIIRHLLFKVPKKGP